MMSMKIASTAAILALGLLGWAGPGSAHPLQTDMMGQGPGQGMGAGMGHGMMGPGMMGQGPGPMGQGMMGPGMGPGPMGQGMMGPGPMGPGMGPGMMMGQGTGQGFGPGAMGPGMGMRGFRVVPTMHLSTDDVRVFLERHISAHGLTRLQVGEVTQTDDDTITADIVTQDGSLAVRLEIDAYTGFVESIS